MKSYGPALNKFNQLFYGNFSHFSRREERLKLSNRLLVLFAAPPSSVEILDHKSDTKIEIKENEELHLECTVRKAKPAAKIVWFRGDVELNIRKLAV